MTTVLTDVIFPRDIALQACEGAVERLTGQAQSIGGFTQRAVLREKSLRAWEFGLVPRPTAQWLAIHELFEVVDGSAYAFLLRDPVDSLVTAGKGVLQPLRSDLLQIGVAGFGWGVPTYRLTKRYQVGSRFKDREIRHPITRTVSRGASVVTEGISAGNVSINATTGIVTFVADATSSINSATPGATTDVVLNASIGLTIGARMWLQGFTGTGASRVNQRSHEILNISGSTYTLAVDTSGLTLTGSGQAHAYPQASEALSWVGSFHTAVRFANDRIDWRIVAGGSEPQRLVVGPSVLLVEERERDL